MSEQDQNIVKALYRIIDLIKYAGEVGNLHSCNDCKVVRHCPKAPRPGQMVRYNCFAWEGEE